MRTTGRFPTSWEEVPLILDIPWLCRLLGRSQESMKKLCQQGKIPAFKAGKEWRIDKTALQAWMQEQYPAGSAGGDTPCAS